MEARPSPFPASLTVHGAATAGFETVLAVDELPQGAMHRISRGDLDILLANTASGIGDR